ncbi:hypothetical protein GCM10027280_03710 [Micromonospora polyrhachis]
MSSIALSLGLIGVTLVATGTPVFAVEPGKKVCTINDPRLRELSGLVATEDGYIVVNDGTEIESRKQVFYLDSNCKGSKSVGYSGNGPFDTEDLALSADRKTLWIADIGDNATNSERRTRVALWSMPVDGSKKPVLHRLRYPDDKPRDAEALIMGEDNLPIIITKSTGKAEIFTVAEQLPTNNTEPVAMKAVGELTVPKTATENPLQAAGRIAVTGAARSPDGSRVVVRTYADAFEYDVTNGDVVKALTTGRPRVTPLGDPFGESISYTPDGATFLTVSDVGNLGDDTPVTILSYTPSKTLAVDAKTEAEEPADGRSWIDKLDLDDITYLIIGVGLFGVVLVGFGVFGIIRSRRKPRGPDSSRRGKKDDGSGPQGAASDGDPSTRRGERDGRNRGGEPDRRNERGGTPDQRDDRDAWFGGQAGRGDQSESSFVPSRGGNVRGAAQRPEAAESQRQRRPGPEERGGVYGGHSDGGAVYGGGSASGAVYGGNQASGRTSSGGYYGDGRPAGGGQAPGEGRAGARRPGDSRVPDDGGRRGPNRQPEPGGYRDERYR